MVCKDCCKAYDLPGMLEGSDPKEALRGFAEVVRMEPEKGEWCAQALRCCYGQSKQLDAQTGAWPR